MCLAFLDVSCSKETNRHFLSSPISFLSQRTLFLIFHLFSPVLFPCSFSPFSAHPLIIFTSLSLATHLPSPSFDQSLTDSRICSTFLSLPLSSAVLSVGVSFSGRPLFLFLMFLLFSPITFCLHSLVFCFSSLPFLSLSLSLSACC